MKFNVSYKEQEPFYLDALYSLGIRNEDLKRLSEADIACSCPICGDSRQGNKRRLHFYQRGDVINVNCFNGDCPVVNMTLYTFLKNYSPRILTSYKDFLRSRYLIEIGGRKKKPIKTELEVWTADGLEELDEESKLVKFIEGFVQEDEDLDLQKIKEFLACNPESQKEFKMLLES